MFIFFYSSGQTPSCNSLSYSVDIMGDTLVKDQYGNMLRTIFKDIFVNKIRSRLDF